MLCIPPIVYNVCWGCQCLNKTQSEFWQTSRQLWASLQRTFKFIYGNWKHSIAGIAAAAALVGEVYIVVQANKEGNLVCSEIYHESTGQAHHSYFFWLALGIVVACANNLVIAGLATFKNVYLRTNREKNTRWLLPLFTAYLCVMGLMSGILRAALRPHDGPSLFAIVSILSIYSQSVLWAIILGWRDVEKDYKGSNPTPAAPAAVPSLPPTTVTALPPNVPPATVTAKAPAVLPPQQPSAPFLPVL